MGLARELSSDALLRLNRRATFLPTKAQATLGHSGQIFSRSKRLVCLDIGLLNLGIYPGLAFARTQTALFLLHLDFYRHIASAIILEEHKKGFFCSIPRIATICHSAWCLGNTAFPARSTDTQRFARTAPTPLLARRTNTNIVCLSIKLRFTYHFIARAWEKYGGLWTWIYGLDFFFPCQFWRCLFDTRMSCKLTLLFLVSSDLYHLSYYVMLGRGSRCAPRNVSLLSVGWAWGGDYWMEIPQR